MLTYTEQPVDEYRTMTDRPERGQQKRWAVLLEKVSWLVSLNSYPLAEPTAGSNRKLSHPFQTIHSMGGKQTENSTADAHSQPRDRFERSTATERERMGIRITILKECAQSYWNFYQPILKGFPNGSRWELQMWIIQNKTKQKNSVQSWKDFLYNSQ